MHLFVLQHLDSPLISLDFFYDEFFTMNTFSQKIFQFGTKWEDEDADMERWESLLVIAHSAYSALLTSQKAS